MSENHILLEQLEQLLSWKKSKKFYADKLNITETEVDLLLKELKDRERSQDDAEVGNYVAELQDVIEQVINFQEDLAKGTGEIILNTKNEIKTLDELIDKCNIDVEKWEITKYVQNYWGNGETPHWQVKAWLSKKKNEQVFQDSFIDFLKEYKSVSQAIVSPKFDFEKSSGMLVINKQDSHLNKFDIDGDNCVLTRLSNIMYKVNVIVNQAILSNNLEEITYIIGSDEFNSEFTGTTTKGTPQTNTHTHQTSFQYICDHEVLMITMLLQYAEKVNVVYVAGNHDEYVGWHMVNWLKCYFKDVDRLTVDDGPKYRKYISYGQSA